MRVGSRFQQFARRPRQGRKLAVFHFHQGVVKNPPAQKSGADFWSQKFLGDTLKIGSNDSVFFLSVLQSYTHTTSDS